MKKVRDTPDWKEYMEKGAFNTTSMSGEEFKKWLGAAEATHKTLMTEAGFPGEKVGTRGVLRLTSDEPFDRILAPQL